MAFTLNLDQSERVRCNQAGGKGYTLAKLRQAGFPVPPGFVITTNAYWDYVTANGFDALIADALACDHPAAASARIVAAFEAGVIPAPIAAAIGDAYRALGEGRVAVRSSALTEDGGNASFAGQYESILDVLDYGELLAAIRRCWASLWSTRALAYRRLRAWGDVPAMAVVVQEMVSARQSGVAFTCDPVTSDHRVIIIEAVNGGGDALMGGRVTPQRYAVPRDGGWRQAGAGVLDAVQLETVVRLAQQVERWADCPQDVEWALDAAGQIQLLQARPITAMEGNQIFTAGEAPEPGYYWTRDNVGEVVPEPVTPLSWSVLEPLGNSAFASVLRRLGVDDYPDAGLFGRFYGRVYLNQTLFQAMMGHFYISRAGWRALPRLTLAALRALLLLRRLPAESEDVIELVLEHRCSEKDLAFWRRVGTTVMEVHLAVSVIAELLYQALGKLMELWNLDDIPVTALTAGLTGVRSAEAGRKLAVLAGTVRRDENLRALLLREEVEDLPDRLLETDSGRVLWAQIEAFLAEHGYSAAQEFELATPRWRDDPAILLRVLQTQVRAMNQVPATDPGTVRRDAVARVERELNWLQLLVFHRVLRWTQDFTVIRENLKYHFVIAHGHLRDRYLALAERLVANGRLAHLEDIFFLTTDEVSALKEGSLTPDEREMRIAGRRQEWAADRRATAPFALHQLADGRLRAAAASVPSEGQDGARLCGFAASPGVYTGRARVVLTLADGIALEPGEVLVTQATSPAWAPLLLSANALVTEIGGTLSHGAIIAREYGLPAVLNVADATQLIRSGQLVHVDGFDGTVQLLEDADA